MCIRDSLRRALSTQIRIINLHALIEHTALFAFVHRLDNFVLPEPRGWVGITYLPLVFERLNGVLALLHQIDPKEPLVQRQFRVLTSESMIEEH